MTKPLAAIGLSIACAIVFLVGAGVGATAAAPNDTGGSAGVSGLGAELGVNGTPGPGRPASPHGATDHESGANGARTPADAGNDPVRGTNMPSRNNDDTTGPNGGSAGNGNPAVSPRASVGRTGE